MSLSKEEIRSLLNDIENERIERTISTDNTRKMSEAICSFANDIRNTNKPGYFIIGATDDGKLEGLRFTDEQLRSYAGLRNTGAILPHPAMMVYKETFEDGDVAIEVQPSHETPVRYKGVIYIRVGARKAEANSEEERILTEKGQAHSSSFDGRPCREATINDLDLDLFRKLYLPKAVAKQTLANDNRDITRQMASLRLFDNRFNCPTYAGILLLAHNAQYFIPGAYIQYVKFAGKDRVSQVLKENRFTGNLISMLMELEYFIKYSIEVQRPEFVSILREENHINYPCEAIRELAMNAVMHRAYNGNNSPIKFYEYCDRLEIDNPGNLYGKVNPENFPNETDYRNPNIAEIMKNLGYVNKFGSGVNTVTSLLAENGNRPPQFILGDISTFKVVVISFDVTVNRPDVIVNRPDVIVNRPDVIVNRPDVIVNPTGTSIDQGNSHISRKERIIRLMQQNKRISVKQIASELGVTSRTIFRLIDTLKSEGKIERHGSDKAGTWIVVK